MLIDKLRNYYGFPDNEQAQYINQRTMNMSEAKQDEIAQKIIENRSKRFGFPDISILAKFINDNKEKHTRVYYWSVCNDCKSEFDFQFMTCPVCHQNGKRSSGYKVKTSEYPIPKTVIRWNLPVLNVYDKGKYCVNCEQRGVGFCSLFGNPDRQCSPQDFEYCACKQCCAFHKKYNAGLKV